MTNSIDQRELEIRFERLLPTSPERAFDAWTTPEEVALWWDPTGTPLVACAIDARPEGKFRFVTGGHAPPFEGVYRVVKRPEKLQFEAMGALGTVTFEPSGGATLMRVVIRSPSKEHFETFVSLGVDKGTAVTLDRLVAHLQ